MSEIPDIPQRDAPRVTPFELVFGRTVFDESQFRLMQEQADAAGAHRSSELFMLPAAGELLQRMTPPQGGREAVAQVRALIFAAFRFWRSGCNVYRIPEPMLRELLGDASAPALPVSAGYVQLPRNLMWARVAEDAAPEPVDGYFWSVPEDDHAGETELVYAMGVRPGRPGLSLFELRLETFAQLEAWGQASGRESDDDFANVLPGGELQGYLALTTAAEALKLAALCFTRIGATRWSVVAEDQQRIHEPADG